ncbi:unnamed protein product [Amaranthus hypochondriacus]
MGVKNLWDILDSCKKTLPLHHLQNKRVCIDLSCWMVQLQSVNRNHCAMKEKVYLRGLFHRLRALISLNCSVIFVADGAIPAIKISTYRRRLNSLNEVTKDDVELQKVTSLRRNMGSEFSGVIKEAKILGMALGIPCLDGIEEAEAQCALLNLESICDGCFSSDSDIFLFGARTVYREICLEKGGYVVCYEMSDIEKKLGLGRHSLVALSLLLGSDYSHGVRGFGPESACQIVKSISEDVLLERIKSDGISFLTSLKTSKKHGRLPDRCGKENFDPQVKESGDQLPLQKDSEVVKVIEAYMNPKCHLVDSDPVYRVLAVHHFQRAKLQEICSKFFEWPPEKTDEYILPRIAERELRRFANLRLSSSRLGATIPLHMMPVKCPISEVLKQRRVQGRESLEVSWQDFDGLKSSVVPADLVERACPEKIVEFEERKAQLKIQKRRKPKAKKSNDTASMANVDTKLQNLLLDIESENTAKHENCKPNKSEDVAPISNDDSRLGNPLIDAECDLNTRHKPTSCANSYASRSNIDIDLTIPGTFDQEYDSNINSKPTVTYHITSMSRPERLFLDIDFVDDLRDNPASRSGSSAPGNNIEIDLTVSEPNSNKLILDYPSYLPTNMETDVIDLSSPSPVPSTRYVSKCQGNNGGQINVIDLSDSDMEISPEHDRKARELRVFLASIRK